MTNNDTKDQSDKSEDIVETYQSPLLKVRSCILTNRFQNEHQSKLGNQTERQLLDIKEADEPDEQRLSLNIEKGRR